MPLNGGLFARQLNKSLNTLDNYRKKQVPSRHGNKNKTDSDIYKRIVQALKFLNDTKGSTAKAIGNFLYQRGYFNRTTPKHYIAVALQRARNEGVVQRCDNGRYKLKENSKVKKSARGSKPHKPLDVGSTQKTSVKCRHPLKTSTKRHCKYGEQMSPSHSINLVQTSAAVKDLRYRKSQPAVQSHLIQKKNDLKKIFRGYNLDTMMQAIGAPSPMSIVDIGPMKVPAMIDTGAVFSLMSPVTYRSISQYFPLLSPEDAPILKQVNCRAVNNSVIPLRGVFRADVTVGTQTVKDAYIVVTERQSPGPTFIVGMNIIRHLKWADDLPSITLLDIVHCFLKKNYRYKKEENGNFRLSTSSSKASLD